MNIVVVTNYTLYTDDLIRSIKQGMQQPKEILVGLASGADASRPAAGPTPYDGVVYTEVPDNYGELGILVSAMKRYSHSDIHFLYLHGNCTYPPHLIREYELSVKEIGRGLNEKLPNNRGSVYGLGGVVMVADKQRNMELELKTLMGELTESYEQRSLIGCVRENATVDFLEAFGSILIHQSFLKDDFVEYLDTTMGVSGLSTDIILSNYFARNAILRTQICNLAINRYMLFRSGCLKNYVDLCDQDKRVLYERTVKHLRSVNCFSCYQ